MNDLAVVLFFSSFFVLFLLLVAAFTIRRVVIFEYQRGLLYRSGKFVRILDPGAHWIFRPSRSVNILDVRIVSLTLQGQEVLSSDNVGIKISLAVSYKVTDPYLAVNSVVNYQESLYQLLQLNLRDLIGSLEVEDLLAKRGEIGSQLFEKSKEQAAGIGLKLLLANIKDIMFPGDLKNIFAQVVNAKKEGLAALERARGEGAALRSLANAAKVLDNNPSLMQLRFFQVLEKSKGNTLVVSPSESLPLGKIWDQVHGNGEK